MKKILFSLLLLGLMVAGTGAGCNGQHCIKVGGNYEGIDGQLEYCFNAADSQELGLPVLMSKTGDSLYSLGEDEVRKLNEELDKGTMEVKTLMTDKETGKHDEIKKLLKRLRK